MSKVRQLLTKQVISAFVAGVVFAVGLVIAGMTQPGKVVAFLDFAGDWDPSLAFVMVGAIAVYSSLFRWVLNQKTPVLGKAFSLPTRKDIDARLVVGAVLFGAGWGLGGFCPGPALASIGTGSGEVIIFVAAMLVGMLSFGQWQKAMDAKAAKNATKSADG